MKVAEPENTQQSDESLRKRSRFRFAKQILRPLPRRAMLHRYPVLKWFAATARKKPYLWSFRVQQVTPAIYAGCILSFLPAYGIQVALAFFAALVFRANLLVAVALQFITNPVTVWFIYPSTVWVGQKLIRYLRLGEIDSPVGSVAYAAVIGGIFVGLITAVILDVIYRIGSARARNRPLDVKRMLKR